MWRRSGCTIPYTSTSGAYQRPVSWTRQAGTMIAKSIKSTEKPFILLLQRLQNQTPAACHYQATVTTRSAHSAQLGGGRAKPCRRVVLSGNTGPGRIPRRAHTHGVDRGETPRATNTSCVTGSLHARIEGIEATLTPRPLIPSVPLGPSENPPQTPSKDPRKALPSGPTGPVLAEDGRIFEYRLEKRRAKGAT